jgi:hypothetical protein
MDTARVIDGRFRLERELGRHGSVVTWLATDLQHNRPCTAKEFLLGRAGPAESLAQFRARSAIISHLDHPGIPAWIAFTCQEEGIDVRCLLVQEFVEGETLAAAVAGGRRFTEERAASLLWQAASVLRYLHRYSPPLVHGNIKPSNIILGKDGVLRLTDFSFPNLPRADEVLPAPGTEELTSGYTPPEALEGAATPASDVFSLGMSLIYALSGEQPSFVGRAGGRAALPETARVSDWLVRFLERMTDPDPAERFQDGAALREALPVWAGRVRAGGKRFPWAVLAAGAGALFLGWLALAVPWSSRRSGEPATPTAPGSGSHAQAPRDTHPAAPPELSTSKRAYAPGEPVTVFFGGFPGNQTDWVTIVEASAPDSSYAEWFYLKGEREGRRTFKGLRTGSYEVRGYHDWPAGDYRVQGRYAFTVTAPPVEAAPAPGRPPAPPPPPEAPAPQTLVEGRLRHGGRPLEELTPLTPVFWFRNEARNVVERPVVEYEGGRFRIAGLPAGEIGMSVRVDLEPGNPPVYPGDLDAWDNLKVPDRGVLAADVALREIIRLREPRDNGALIPGWDVECGRGSRLESPVTFRWDRLDGDADYTALVTRVNCRDGYRTTETAFGTTTRETAVTVPLAPSRDGECYAFHLAARRGGVPVGMFTTHGERGLGWDFRFIVAP